MKYIFTLHFLFFWTTVSFSQNYRDILIQDSIYPLLFVESDYHKVKNLILKLEQNYGEEPDLKYKLLDNSFKNGDYQFFKKELKNLVKHYGVNIIYFKGNESYYKAITEGFLSKWFKNMYLKNHPLWMKHNFLKQIDQKKLNDIKDKDQLVNVFAINIKNETGLDSLQRKKVHALLQDFFFENISDLYVITRKYDAYPTGKSFAVIQNHFGVALIHNYQSVNNFDKTWTLFYPYYKKSYLNTGIDYIAFKNYDNLSYIHYGTQRFGLLDIENIPEIFKKESLDFVPIQDEDFLKEIRKKFHWENN